MTAPRLLAVFAHPDDESLLAGGTLAACSAAGIDASVVSLTRGEQGPIHVSGVSREQLAAVRERELRTACTALGVSGTCLDLPDGELPWSAADVAVRRLLRFYEPDVVLTFDPEGWYGHPDHIAVYRAVIKEAQRCGSARPWVYEATWPHGTMARLVESMRRRGLSTDLWGLHPDDFGVPWTRLSGVIDVRPYVSAKLRALRSHRTQFGEGYLIREIPDDLAQEFLGQEYVGLALAGNTGTNPLSGLMREGALYV